MLKFKDIKYKRPEIEKVQEQFNQLLYCLNSAETVEIQYEIIKQIYKIRSEIETTQDVVFIRFTLDTGDEFYQKEKEFIDKIQPIYEGLISNFYKALLNSKFRKLLEERLGKQLFTIAELKVKLFSEEIVEDLQNENALVSQYTMLKASGEIMFEGKNRSLYEMYSLMQSKDREIRRRAYEAYYGFFENNEQEFDKIFDDLVKVRDRMAKKLGFESFVEVGYARMSRSDYNAEMVANYRKQILQYIVPVVTKLREKQAKRLGLDSLKCYDEEVMFKTGNAAPEGDPEKFVELSRVMYSELSPETHSFFSYMAERELMDLVGRKGKAGNGYCTHLHKYKAPFIFSNFNGTAMDVNTLTHEAGHALQKYCSKDYDVIEYLYPTKETAEIYSMSMELFTWPWMDLFFKKDGDKYRYSNLVEALIRIPYMAVGDEFQEWVYRNPKATPRERKGIWREIEKKYIPYRDYDGNGFLEDGGYWFKQMHFYGHPFYFIDYSIAQICSIQFWVKFNENRKKAMEDYLALCRAGGSRSFLEQLEIAGLNSPFEDGGVSWVIKPVEEWLNNIDDSKF